MVPTWHKKIVGDMPQNMFPIGLRPPRRSVQPRNWQHIFDKKLPMLVVFHRFFDAESFLRSLLKENSCG